MQKKSRHRILRHETEHEQRTRASFVDLLKDTPIPDNEILQNLGLYLNRKSLSRLLYIHELYQQIIDVHGVVIEFGVRWGQNLALFESFRGMYEPYNYTRKIIGFDTFAGHASIDPKDGKVVAKEKTGAYSVTKGYKKYLEEVLTYHEGESPIPHIQKSELVEGDAVKTINEYLKKHPETIIAFAYFDMGLYKPTKACLEAIQPHLTKGSIIAFDELGKAEYPGETLAFKEVLGFDKYRLRRSRTNSYPSYVVIE